ncbi:TPA: hypothetical protein ACU1RX_002432 [Staphylococcus aureus]|nr:hypothetical protein [Staphylococcus aureus]MBU9768475.1 hypothetical protein [Staphylococcus aureus]MCE5083464.1 hypothetical protein [Staphylococcus aureus]MCE5088747.1 hypothetical protein [Staphylococcus aureus]MCE5134457.1 hypothetical protein [Staphylococcus aureus]MCE5136914.1 hypothetical protein [Staphylococcus aureus]
MMLISFVYNNMDNNNTINRNLLSEFAIIMLLKINEKGAV